MDVELHTHRLRSGEINWAVSCFFDGVFDWYVVDEGENLCGTEGTLAEALKEIGRRITVQHRHALQLLERLHDSEINSSVSAMSNGSFEWRLGDGWNGYIAIGNAGKLEGALRDLNEAALRHYPQSVYAKAA